MAQKGSKAANSEWVFKRLQDMFGDDWNPLLRMTENVMEMQRLVDEGTDDPLNDRATLVDKWEKLAPYVHAKLKSVDHTSGGESIIPQITVEYVKGSDS